MLRRKRIYATGDAPLPASGRELFGSQLIQTERWPWVGFAMEKLSGTVSRQLVATSLLVWCLFAFACASDAKGTQVCTNDISALYSHVPKPFTELILSGDRHEIETAALEMNSNYRKLSETKPEVCDVWDGSTEAYRMSFRPENRDFSGGYLDLYFKGDVLKAVEITMIYCP